MNTAERVLDHHTHLRATRAINSAAAVDRKIILALWQMVGNLDGPYHFIRYRHFIQ